MIGLPVCDPSPQPMWKSTVSCQVMTGAVMQSVSRENHLLEHVSAHVITLDCVPPAVFLLLTAQEDRLSHVDIPTGKKGQKQSSQALSDQLPG